MSAIVTKSFPDLICFPNQKFLAEINSVNVEMDQRPGPYYFIQEVKKGTTKKINKANFKKGRFYNHEDVIIS